MPPDWVQTYYFLSKNKFKFYELHQNSLLTQQKYIDTINITF